MQIVAPIHFFLFFIGAAGGRQVGKEGKKEVGRETGQQKKTLEMNCTAMGQHTLRSQILGSFEITKTNGVNLHGFCTDSF